MLIANNSKSNIAFTGLKEDLEVSQQIIRNFRRDVGRPRSNTYIEAKIHQYEHDGRHSKFIYNLKILLLKYDRRVQELWADYDDWVEIQKLRRNDNIFNSYTRAMEKLKELMLEHRAGNCQDMAELVQYEHLKRGIATHNVGFNIYNKDSNELLRDHAFSLRNLPQNADYTKPETWADAILVDSWCGKGIVDKAIHPKRPEIKGGLDRVLKFFRYNPDRERICFENADTETAETCIKNMKNIKTAG